MKNYRNEYTLLLIMHIRVFNILLSQFNKFFWIGRLYSQTRQMV